MKLYFDDPTFDFQVQRTAAKASYGCADLGEVFAIAARITMGDLDSWYREWFAAGESNQKLAEKEAASGHEENARQAYLRASEYYRSAYYFCRRDIDTAHRCRPRGGVPRHVPLCSAPAAVSDGAGADPVRGHPPRGLHRSSPHR